MEKLEPKVENISIPKKLKEEFPEEFEKIQIMKQGIEEGNFEKVKKNYIDLSKRDSSFTDSESVSYLSEQAWQFLIKDLDETEIGKLQDEIK